MESRSLGESDDDDEDDLEPISRRLYLQTPLRLGGLRLQPVAQHAIVRVLDDAYASLTGARALMQLSEEDKVHARSKFEQKQTICMALCDESVLHFGDRFYDLGSGVGKAVMVAWMAGLHATGVEIAPSRWEESKVAIATLEAMASSDDIPVGGNDSPCLLPERAKEGMDFVCGNALEFDFTDADILYLANVTFPDWLVQRFADAARFMKPGSRIISYKALNGPEFRVIGTISEPTSWNIRTQWLVQEIGMNHESQEDRSMLSKLRCCNEVFDSQRISFADQI